MKKLYISFILLSTTLLANSQGVDEAYLFAKENSFGTARAVGMGGAFGALGGDMSAVQINPAGVAVFRSPELTFPHRFNGIIPLATTMVTRPMQANSDLLSTSSVLLA